MKRTYPKIETLYKRNEKFKVLTDQLRLPEYELIDKWYVTEKIHGQNVRVVYDGVNRTITYLTREDDNPDNVPGDLRDLLAARFTVEKMETVFGAAEVILFGEGYGAGINKGGNYSPIKDFILFDVLVGDWWLEPADIDDVAAKLGCEVVPCLGFMTKEHITALCSQGFNSIVAANKTGAEHKSEGIIARTVPGLKTRSGERLMFKLKYEDFAR